MWLTRLRNKLKRAANNERFQLIVLLELIIIYLVVTLILPGGEDLYRFYRPMADSCLDCAFTPWYAVWFLFPLRFVPIQFTWSVWTVVTGVGLFWVSRWLGTNPLWVLSAFPTLGLIWLGQTDIIVVVGLALSYRSSNPYLRGFGLLLAAVKPHFAGFAILYLIIIDEQRFRLLLVPMIAAMASFVIWGIDWPLRWLSNIPVTYGENAWTSATLTPMALLAAIGLLFVDDNRSRLTLILIASSLLVPWFGIYSYVLFLVFLAPAWAVPVSFAWALFYPIMGNQALQFAWILPCSLAAYLIWPRLRLEWNKSVIRKRLFGNKALSPE